jgi:hypothetical protein
MRNRACYTIIHHVSAKEYPGKVTSLRGALLSGLLIYLSKKELIS